MLGSVQTHSSMAKARSTRKKVAAKPRASRRESKEKWVRKSVVIDQTKLDVARRLLGVATEKEAVDQALDFVVFYREVVNGIETISLYGGLDDIEGVFKGR
jgi:hypothetical protein